MVVQESATPSATRPSNKEVEAQAVKIVREYFNKKKQELKAKRLQDGYDYDVEPLKLLIEVKGFTGKDSDKKWLNLSRLAQRGYDLAEREGNSYELHIIQFKTPDLTDHTHWGVKGQDVKHIYNYPRVSYEATGDVKERMKKHAKRIDDGEKSQV